jgi:creatinine amidohydrolase
MRKFLSFLLCSLPVIVIAQINRPGYKAIFLEDIPWTKAEPLLTRDAVIVIPLGAGSKEHGPHMPLSADYIQVEFLKNEIAKTEPVIIAPTVNYSYYPFFLNFPGSTTLRNSTAKNTVVDICRSLAGYGPKRFYVINYGVSTNAALKPAAVQLASEGILLTYTNLIGPELTAFNKKILQEKEGTHADEAETSTMLYMYPKKVDMQQAKQEYGKRTGFGIMTRDSTQPGQYVPSGIYGDATLATKEKGKIITANTLQVIKKDIDSLRTAALPQPVAVNGQPYTGEYETPDKKIILITLEQNALYCHWNNRGKEKLYSEGNDYFPGTLFEAWFNRNDAGAITSVRLTLPNGDVVYGKKK